MRQFMIILVANLCSLGAVVCAAFMALHGVHGWGWMLFAAILLHVDLKFGKGEK